MLWDAFVVIVVLFLYGEWRRLSREKGREDVFNLKQQRRIKKFRLFPVPIPIVDGMYVLYIAWKYGVKAINDLIHKLAPGPQDICELPFGPFLKGVFCKDVSVIQKLLNSPDPGHLSRPASVTDLLFDEMLQRGILGTQYEIWTHQRKVISRVFTFQHIKFYMESMNKHSKNLVNELIKVGEDNGGIVAGQELHDSMHSNLIKIMLDFIMGSECSEWKEVLQFAEDFSELREILVYRLFHPEFHGLSPLWWLHPKRKQEKTLQRRMRCYVEKVISYHKMKTQVTRDGETKSKSLVEEMIKHNASSEEMYNEVGSLLAAAHDTVMAALDFLLHHFACHPEYQRRCRDEVDDLMNSHELFSDEESYLDVDHISKLECLERFILESLRIAPTFPITGRELKTPLQIDETLKLERGTLVAISPWLVHHDPRYYPQPEVFDPDRFLPQEVKKRGPGTFLAFTGGLRNCIGRRFGMMELKIVSAWILRNFEICTEDGLHDVKIEFGVTIKPERPFKTTLKIRYSNGPVEIIR